MTDALQVATAERVAMQLPVAGLGSRAIAWLIDAVLMFVVALVLYFAVSFAVKEPLTKLLELAGPLKAALGAGVLLVLWSYWTIFEQRWQGQTPGKRLLRIRVVRDDGSPVTAGASALRNLLRLIDFLPTCYPVGLAVMLADAKHRRLGDLIAGTLLVRDERVDLSRYERVHDEVRVEVAEVASDWLLRWGQLEQPHRDRIGRRLLTALGEENAAEGEALRDLVRARLEQRP